MKVITLAAATLITSFAIISCGGGAGKEAATADGFSSIEESIKSKFGENAYFTKLSIIYDKSIGNMISVTVTEDPESLRMGEWTQAQGTWKQTSEVSLEVPEGTKAADFMYQLDDKINLKTLGELIEKSKKQLETEKSLSNPTLSIASIIYPKNGDISKATYSIDLKPENGGTTFMFSYKLNGELIKMDY